MKTKKGVVRQNQILRKASKRQYVFPNARNDSSLLKQAKKHEKTRKKHLIARKTKATLSEIDENTTATSCYKFAEFQNELNTAPQKITNAVSTGRMAPPKIGDGKTAIEDVDTFTKKRNKSKNKNTRLFQRTLHGEPVKLEKPRKQSKVDIENEMLIDSVEDKDTFALNKFQRKALNRLLRKKKHLLKEHSKKTENKLTCEGTTESVMPSEPSNDGAPPMMFARNMAEDEQDAIFVNSQDSGIVDHCINFELKSLTYDRNFDDVEELEWDPSTISCHLKKSSAKSLLVLLNVDNLVILGAKCGQTFSTIGLFELGVLRGMISCLGYKITSKSNHFHQLSSTRNHSLSLEAQATEQTINLDIVNYLNDEQLSEFKHNVLQTNSEVIFVMRSYQNKISRYLQEFHPNLLLKFSSSSTNTQCHRGKSFSISDAASNDSLVVSKDWKTALGMLNECQAPVILVCGPTNVGKSTFIKFLMNSYVSGNEDGVEAKGLWYVEMDPGQSEFVPPGCVSLKYINQPTLSPQYLHMSGSTRSLFVGGVSVADNPDLYITAIEELFITLLNVTKNSEPTPVVINTMGWVKGLGLNLLMDIIRIFKPSHIIQMESSVGNNIKEDITPDFMASSSGWRYNPGFFPPHPFETIQMASAVPSSNASRYFTGRNLRSLCLLAYFARMQNSTLFKPINHFEPFKIDFQNLVVHICNHSVPDDHIVNALNGSLVTLCSLTDEQRKSSSIEECSNGLMLLKNSIVCPRIGLGIIRAIDQGSKSFYILSPLSLDEIQQVNIAMMSNIEVPFKLLTTQVCSNVMGFMMNSSKSTSVVDNFVPNKLPRKVLKKKTRKVISTMRNKRHRKC